LLECFADKALAISSSDQSFSMNRVSPKQIS